MNKIEKLSILGCGWLGKPLAISFIEKGKQVKGSTRSEDKLSALSSEGIIPYQIKADPFILPDQAADFFTTDCLILNIPPERKPDVLEYYTAQTESILKAAIKGTIRYVIFTSSTSVYADNAGEAIEDQVLNPDKLSGKTLIKSEDLVRKYFPENHLILRLAGLVGPDRHPGRFLAGKKDIPNGNAPVNLVHLNDCIGSIHALINGNIWGETFNVCSPEHPTKKDFYTNAAISGGYEPPQFGEVQGGGKRVSSDKLIKAIDYRFRHLHPMMALEDS
ncbi:MAG: SDR family oxidoreductase [Cyclobacteriaceae bacterium]